jgi:hypothetical protein
MFETLKSLLRGVQDRGSERNLSQSSQIFSQAQPVANAAGITFAVDKVKPASDSLRLWKLGESLEMRSDSSILIMPDRELPALAPEGYTSNEVDGEARLRARARIKVARGATSTVHPLVDAIHLAFSDHRPLVLTPDSLWLTIVQGFGHHVHQNAEGLRSRIVRHEGKLEIRIRTKSFDSETCPSVISQISDQIRENSDPVLHETLLCDFSTTTPAIKTAYEMALMDTYQPYFDYRIECVCGIPEITLAGTPEDWQRMRDRLEVLATFDLIWWTSRVGPILDQFIATAQGHPDRKFWKAIYKPEKAYAEKLASGWIADLFPYLLNLSAELPSRYPEPGLWQSPGLMRNPILNTQRKNWLPAACANPLHQQGISLKHFPSGLSRAPGTLEFPDGSQEKIFFVSGFVGISQFSPNHALSPAINWAVVKTSHESASPALPESMLQS